MSEHASGPHIPAQCRLVTRPATNAAAGELTAANSMTQRLFARGTSATRCFAAHVIHAAQTAICTMNAATTIPMSGIRLAARSVFFAAFIFLLLLFVPEPRIRAQKLDVAFEVKMAAHIRESYFKAKSAGELPPRHLQHERLHDLA